MWLKQSTSASCIVGPILDSTGAEYASAVIGDLSISKNGGTLTALASAATLTYIANGYYTLSLTTGNTDTVGRVEISCNKSTYQMPQKNFLVLLASVFDALITNAANATGGLIAATATVSAAAGYIGASGAAINGTNVNTLSGHDPGATLGTSTLTQAQVTGGAYALNSSSFAWNTALDFSTTQKTSLNAATPASVTGAVGSVTGDVGGNVVGSVGSISGVTFPTNFSAMAITSGGVVQSDLQTIKTQTVTCAAGVTVGVYVGGTAAAATATALSTLQTTANTINTTTGTYLDATVSSRMATYTQPSGFLAATFPSTVASTTNITGGTITTVTNLTNLPAITADWLTGTGIATSAVTKLQSGLATSSQLDSAVWAQTRFRFSIPEAAEVPESGTATYTLGITTYDASGALTDLDSSPTIHAYYADGTSADALLGSVTHVTTGEYTIVLSVAAGTTSPQFLRFVGSGTMSSVPLGMTDYTWIVDNVAEGFTAGDRSNLDAIFDKLPANNIADQTLLNTAVSGVASQTDQLSFSSYGVLSDVRGIAGHATAVDTGTAGVVSFVSGAYVMTSGDTVSANIVQVDGENISSDGNGHLYVYAEKYYDFDLDSFANYPVGFTSFDAQLAAIVADTNELQADWVNGGRLDLILDSRSSQASVDDIPTNAEFEARTILAASYGTAANQATIIGYIDMEVAAIKAKTDQLTFTVANQVDANSLSGTLNASGIRSAIGMATANLDAQLGAIDDFLDTEIAAIKAKTDGLPADPADASDIAAAFATVNTKLDAIDDFIDTEVAAIKAKTDNLPSDPADQSLLMAAIDAIPTAAEIDTQLSGVHGSGSWGSGDAGGSGARTVALTVNDGTTAIESAHVRLTKGAESYVLDTDASGHATFSLDDGTWSVAITSPGYTFTPTTLVVAANVTRTYSMTQVTITPSDPGQVTGFIYCYDENGVIEEGVEIHLHQLRPISGTGIAYDSTVRTGTSDADGLVEFTGMFKGGRYSYYRGTSDDRHVEVTVPTTATDPYELRSISGTD